MTPKISNVWKIAPLLFILLAARTVAAADYSLTISGKADAVVGDSVVLSADARGLDLPKTKIVWTSAGKVLQEGGKLVVSPSTAGDHSVVALLVKQEAGRRVVLQTALYTVHFISQAEQQQRRDQQEAKLAAQMRKAEDDAHQAAMDELERKRAALAEQQQRAAEDVQKKQAEQQAKDAALAQQQKQAADELEAKRAELAEQQKQQAEELQKKKAEQEAKDAELAEQQRKAADELEQKRAELAAQQQRDAEELKKKQAEQEAKDAALATQQKQAADELEKKRAEQAARDAAWAEQQKKAAEELEQKRAELAEQQQRDAEELTKKQAEREATDAALVAEHKKAADELEQQRAALAAQQQRDAEELKKKQAEQEEKDAALAAQQKQAAEELEQKRKDLAEQQQRDAEELKKKQSEQAAKEAELAEAKRQLAEDAEKQRAALNEQQRLAALDLNKQRVEWQEQQRREADELEAKRAQLDAQQRAAEEAAKKIQVPVAAPAIVAAPAVEPEKSAPEPKPAPPISAILYEVDVTGPRPEGRAPRLWDAAQRKLVEAPDRIAVLQDISFSAEVSPKAPSGASYEWTIQPAGCSTVTPFQRDIRARATAVGTYEVAVTVRDKSGELIGTAATSVTVSVSREDLEDGLAAQEADMKVSLAKDLVAKGSLDDALTVVAEALKLDPSSKDASSLANTWSSQRKEVMEHLAQGRAWMAKQDYDQAHGEWDKAHAMQPRYAPVWELEEDLRTMKRVLDRAQDLINEGYALERRGDSEGAVAKYQSALKLSPDARVTTKIAELKKQMGEAEAQKLVDEGYALEKSGDIPGAIAKYEEAIANIPNDRVAAHVKDLESHTAPAP